MLWFYNVKRTKFLFFIDFIATQKKKIMEKTKKQTEKYMWNQYYYFD